jgi:hypothetical protein
MKRLSIWPMVAFLFFSVPILLFAFPQPPTGNTGAPGDGNCSGCHNGSSTGGSTSVKFPSGLSYKPGVTQHLSVTVSDTTHSVWSFQLTARLASNTSSQAGSFTATDTANTVVQTSGSAQDIETTNSGIQISTWNLDWTPPSTNVGNVNLYLTGMGAGSPGGSTNGNGIYNASYMLTPAAAATPDFSLAASPTSLTLTQGSSGSSNITVTPQNGFNSTVTLAASGLPSGVTPAFSSTGTMTLSASSTAATGSSTVTITGTSGSLIHTTTVSLTVNAAAAATLTATPTSLSFTAQPGGAAPASKNVSVGSSVAGLTFTTATSGGSTWLTATPAVGNAPGTVSVSVNPTNLTAGSYAGIVTITASSGSPQATVDVALTVSNTSSTGITATPSSISFTYQTGGRVPSPRTLTITSTSGSTTYTASETESWLSISPTNGNTPGRIRVSVNPTGMTAGNYTAQINITPPNGQTITIPATLSITSSGGGDDGGGDDGGGTPSGMYAQAYVNDPTQSGALVAAWVDNLGSTPHSTTDPRNQGLVLSKNATAPADGYAGAVIQNAVGISLTELGFDYRAGIQCSADTPHFVVVTTDGVTHTLGGCASGAGTTQSTATMGWIRLRFDPTKATPQIQPTSHLQSITVVLDKGPNQNPNAAGSIAVIDNIDVNGVIVPKR